MAQGSDDFDDDRSDHAGADEHERWLDDAPTAAVARVVLELDEAIPLKRRVVAAWLTALGDAVPLLPVKPTLPELAVVIALAEIYGAALINDARLVPVIDFITDVGAVKLVQRVMFGARPITDFDDTAYAAENVRLAELLREARTAFEFLCATWPEAFMAQASDALAQLGLPRLRTSAPPPTDGQRDGGDESGDESDDEPGQEPGGVGGDQSDEEGGDA